MSVTAPGGTFTLAHRSVARIGFGAMQLSSPDGAMPPRAAAVALLRYAIELGVNHIDTAQFYGDGVANGLIRQALAPYPEQLVLASKVGAAPDEHGRLVAAQRPEQLRAQVETNLVALGVDRIDVINLRRMDQPPGIVAGGDQLVDLDSQLAELVALRDAGTIGAIGLSNVTLEQLRAALPAGITCVQNAYSLARREDEPLLACCRQHGIAWVPFFPLGSAFPDVPKVTERPAVVAVASELGVTPAQVGLAWLLAHAPNILLIPGTADAGHLTDNVAAGTVALDADTMRRIETNPPLA